MNKAILIRVRVFLMCGIFFPPTHLSNHLQVCEVNWWMNGSILTNLIQRHVKIVTNDFKSVLQLHPQLVISLQRSAERAESNTKHCWLRNPFRFCFVSQEGKKNKKWNKRRSKVELNYRVAFLAEQLHLDALMKLNERVSLRLRDECVCVVMCVVHTTRSWAPAAMRSRSPALALVFSSSCSRVVSAIKRPRGDLMDPSALTSMQSTSYTAKAHKHGIYHVRTSISER